MGIGIELKEGTPSSVEGGAVAADPKGFSGWPFPDFPNLAQDQATLDGLEQDIKERGVLNPITVWSNSGKAKPPVVKGVTRWGIATKLGHTSIPTIYKEYASADEAKADAILDNSLRRDSTPSGRARMGDELWRLYDVAPDRAAWQAKGMSPRARAAKASKLSEGGLAKFRFIQQNVSDEVKKQLDEDIITINAAYTATMASLKEKTDSAPPPPRIDKILQDLHTLLSTAIFKSRCVAIRPDGDWKPKNKSSIRTIPLPKDVADIIRKIKIRRENVSPEDYVFTDRNGEPLVDHSDYAYHQLDKAWRAATHRVYRSCSMRSRHIQDRQAENLVDSVVVAAGIDIVSVGGRIHPIGGFRTLNSRRRCGRRRRGCRSIGIHLRLGRGGFPHPPGVLPLQVGDVVNRVQHLRPRMPHHFGDKNLRHRIDFTINPPRRAPVSQQPAGAFAPEESLEYERRAVAGAGLVGEAAEDGGRQAEDGRDPGFAGVPPDVFGEGARAEGLGERGRHQ